jgi:Protein of unknown function (DUF2723)
LKIALGTDAPPAIARMSAAPPRLTLAAVVTIALLFLLAHLYWLPPTLEDVDSVNFAMGVREFDVARHQPHPPGYPVYIAIAKVSTAAVRALGVASPEVAGLAVLSAIGGATVVVAAFVFFRRLVDDDRIARIAVVLVVCSPLFWFTALRPLSDVPGLAVAFVALAALMAAVRWRGARTSQTSRALLFGATMAGISIGFRSQMAVLTTPLLLLAVIRPGVPSGSRVAAVVAFLMATLAWAMPLIALTGGPGGYLAALGSQAGEDFVGVVMLWTNPTPRVAVFALLNTFVLPWDASWLGGMIATVALIGAIVLVRRGVSAVLLLLVTFGPYAIFHLLFQETLTVRYALPLVPAVALLAAVTLAEARPVPGTVATAALVVAALIHGVPAGAGFARTPNPVTAAFNEMKVMGGAARVPPIIGMHRRVLTETRRAREWDGPLPGTLLPAPRDDEWLELTRTFKETDAPVWFLADPRRTDLALIDSQYRRTREYRWPFNPGVYLGGGRPGQVDWHIYDSPGWFLERGWALTPEVAGITERDGWGPHRQPSVGWVRRRPGSALMLLGGRHLGGANEPPVRLIASVDDRAVESFVVTPGYFMRFVMIPDGGLSGEGRFARLAVRAEAVAGGAIPRVGLEQFNLQTADAVQFGFSDGWFEPEYNPTTARSWRWMGESAVLQIHNAGRDVTIEVRGESPLRYFEDAPVLRIAVGDQVVSETRPTTDFTVQGTLPAAALAAAKGRVVLTSDKFFIPGEREGSADRRHLALRIYSVTVR